jgi:urea transport system permease protein
MLRLARLILCLVSILTLCAPSVLMASEAIPQEVAQAIRKILDGNGDDREALYQKVASGADGRLVPLFRAYYAGTLARRGEQIVIYQSPVEISATAGKGYPVVDAFTLAPVLTADGRPELALELGSDMIKAPRKERSRVSEVISILTLADPDLAARKQAIIEVGDRGDVSLLAALKAQLSREPPRVIAKVLEETITRIELVHGANRDVRLAAATKLAEVGTSRCSSTLAKALEQAKAEGDGELETAVLAANALLERHLSRMRLVQTSFAGLSLGSILILMALGLSIIFGVMGVINMAHGEFMMVGAFTTLAVSNLFKAHLPPSLYDYYFIAAIPAAFIVAGLVGVLCEVLVIRHLYGRPLETLLATWGISLGLIWLARDRFGDTVSLTPPTWLVGGWEIAPDCILPLNRIFIIGLCATCIAVVYYIIGKTKIGLLLRATTQSRTMAGCLGVPTRRVDGMTFGLGAGLAGLAGVAVPLFDKINPQMGQGYIVDSFMVVVVGGVGKLIGSIVAGLGMGFITKYLEPMIPGTGSVIYTKIIVLLLIIAILQKRPSGLFPARGRLAEA